MSPRLTKRERAEAKNGGTHGFRKCESGVIVDSSDTLTRFQSCETATHCVLADAPLPLRSSVLL